MPDVNLNPNNNIDRPDYVCPAHTRQQEALTMIRDFLGGTHKLIKKREKYLPKETKEKPEAYQLRLDRAALYNMLQKTVGGIVGMVIKDDPIYTGPSLIKEQLDDLDMMGTNFVLFLKDFLFDVVAEGHAHALIDMDEMLETSITSAAPTPDLSDELAAGRRPCWVKYKKDQVINWTSERVGGETVLTSITFKEVTTEPAGKYGQKEVTRYRVFRLPKISAARPGVPARYGRCMWELWEAPEKGDELIPRGSDVTRLSRIPLITVYSKRIGYMESEPPLLDLCYHNKSHYQQLSDQNNQLRWLVPGLFRKLGKNPPASPIDDDAASAQQNTGAGKAQEIEWGPQAIIDGYGPDADLKYVYHDGRNVDAAMKALEATEKRMDSLGIAISIETGKGQATTATRDLLNASERAGEVKTWAKALADGFNQGLYFHALYMNMTDGGKIEIKVSAVDAADVKNVPVNVPPKPAQQMPPESSEMTM